MTKMCQCMFLSGKCTIMARNVHNEGGCSWMGTEDMQKISVICSCYSDLQINVFFFNKILWIQKRKLV